MRRMVTVFLLLCAWHIAGSRASAEPVLSDLYMVRMDRLNRVLGITTEFYAPESLYCMVRLNNAQAGDQLSVTWTALDAGEWQDRKIYTNTTSLSAGETRHPFFLRRNDPWPVGSYLVECTLNGGNLRSVKFDIKNQPAPRTTEFTFVAYTQVGSLYSGIANTARVTVDQNPRNQFSVGIFETAEGGVGPSWRASYWVAPLVSAELTNVSLAPLRFVFENDAPLVDGASAGGLTTVAVLSALRGEPLRTDATMTGTINPDGTIGPVSGIVHKLDGAAAAKKKLVLIPAGSRRQADMNTKQEVDLVERGRSLGLDVREVGDVYAAYQLLTGRELPKLGPDETPRIREENVRDRIRGKVQDWMERYTTAKAEYGKLPAAARYAGIESLMAYADQRAVQATALLQQDQPAAAFAEAHRAATEAAIALMKGRLEQGFIVKPGGDAAALAAVIQNSAAITQQIEKQLLQVSVSTMDQVGGMLMFWTWWRQARANLEMTNLLLAAGTKESADDAKKRLFQASGYSVLANSYLQVCVDYLDLVPNLRGAPVPKEMPYPLVADIFNMAAKASLDLFEATVLQPEADRMGLRLAAEQQLVALKEPLYVEARYGQELVLVSLRNAPTEMIAGEFLGRALLSSAASAGLIAKYYALQGTEDASGAFHIQNREALQNMLDLADVQVRRSINLLQQNGTDGTCCVVLYEAARQLRDGTDDDKLDALYTYWLAFGQARALAFLGGMAPAP